MTDPLYVHGRPHTFGFLRKPEFDQQGREAWEQPEGGIVLIPRNADLVAPRPQRRGGPGRPRGNMWDNSA